MRRPSTPLWRNFLTDGRHPSLSAWRKKGYTFLQTFSELALREAFQRNLANAHHDTPTEIQALALPIALAGQDLIACAQTGGGKTAVTPCPS